MPTQTVTSPVMLDQTGQGIISALGNIRSVLTPTNVYRDVPLTITPSDWSSTSPYTYTWLSAYVTADSGVEVSFKDGAENVPIDFLEYDKVTGGVQFTAPYIPTENVPVIVRILYADAAAIAPANEASEVAQSAISGEATVEDALGNLDNKTDALKRLIGYVEDGDVSTHDYTKGYYIVWKGAAYVTTGDIAIGDTLSLDNLSAINNGIPNNLMGVDNRLSSYMAYLINRNKCSVAIPAGSYVILRNSTIAGRSDGCYVLTAATEANYIITSSPLSPIGSAGVINHLNAKIATANTNISTNKARFDSVHWDTALTVANLQTTLSTHAESMEVYQVRNFRCTVSGNETPSAGTYFGVLKKVNSTFWVVDMHDVNNIGNVVYGKCTGGTWSWYTPFKSQKYTLSANDCSYTRSGVTFTISGGTLAVYIDGFINLPSGGYTKICDIPAGFRPSLDQNSDIVVMDSSSYRTLRVYVSAAGVLRIYNYGSNAYTNNNFIPRLMFSL